MRFIQTASAIAVASLLASVPTLAQTFSSCNPLTQGGCPADVALGKSISVDFTKGAVDSFTTSGNPTYDSNGVSFTVAKSGDSPTLISKFYIMFGKVSITMKVAPGAGIVSTLVLQSDDLDEIDMEWLGADDSEVQTNYFGKGNTATYNRGAFNPAPNNQGEFVTYSIEYTADQVVWSVGGQTVRVLTAAQAEANQYPQTPMQVKFGAWSGGDPSNAAGTIGWARGPTDYTKGPFTMVVQSIDISDYSTGTSYVYTGTSGNWQDIQAVGGSVGANKGSSNTVVAVPPSATSASPSIPVGGFGNGGGESTRTMTGYPWVASTTLQTVSPTTSVAGIPSGWTVSSSGKIVPANSAASTPPLNSPSTTPSPPSPSAAGSGLETITRFDDKGFLTTIVEPAGWSTAKKSYDQQGFLITPGATPTPTPTAGAAAVPGIKAEGDSGKNSDASHSSLHKRVWWLIGLAVAGAAVL